MRRYSALIFFFAAGLLLAGSAWAQNDATPTTNVAQGFDASTNDSGGAGPGTMQHSEFSIQLSGIYGARSGSGVVKNVPTDSAGILAGYRLHFGHWTALEFEYDYTRNGQRFFTPATAPGTTPLEYAITASTHELVLNEVINTPRVGGFFQPFVLGGGGMLIFDPRSSAVHPVSIQGRGAINYGAGVDFHIDHVGMRLEYQGLIFKIPNFKNDTLTVNRFTHIAMPSAGLIFTF